MESMQSIVRLSWKKFIRNNLGKFLFFIVELVLLILSITLSIGIDLNSLDENALVQYNVLIVVSSSAFLLLLGGVLYTFILNNAESLGLKTSDGNYRALQTLGLSLLTMLFASCIYFLLDVALEDALLQLGPVLVFILVLELSQLQITGLTDLTGEPQYHTVRNILFEGLFLVIVVLLIFSMIMVLTRAGRERLGERFDMDIGADPRVIYKILAFLVIPPLAYWLIISFTSQDILLFVPVVLFSLIISIWWLIQFVKIIKEVTIGGVKITPFILSTNFLLIIPIVFVFWVLPVTISTGLTVLDLVSTNQSALDFSLIVTVFLGKMFNFIEIIVFDFLLFIGGATVVIGFAEGASLTSIGRAIKDGAGVSRTGTIALEQAPKIAIWTQYTLMGLFWVSYAFRSLGALWDSLKTQILLVLNLPEFPFPDLIEGLSNIRDALKSIILVELPNLQTILIPLISLIIPLYFILSASFKFLSITFVTQRTKDPDYFIVLVSTTFLLILVQILGDLWGLGIQDAPLRSFVSDDVFNGILGLIHTVEGVFFYVGFAAVFYFLIRRRKLHQASG